MWLALRRLILGFSLIAAVSAILLLSDLNRRRRTQADVPHIAILQYSSRPVMDENVAGMIQGLANEGFVDGQTIHIQRFNAENDMPMANQIARAITDGQYKLVMSSSTPCLQAVANANKAGKAIHVFGAVTDPFGAGVGISRKDPLDHPKHLVGIGTFQPVARTFAIAKEMYPGLKTVGVVWNAAEACSEACVVKARAKCKELDITLLEATVDSSAGVLEAAHSVVAREAEAMWIGGDNTVELAIDALVAAAKQGHIPVFCNNPGIVERGPLFGLGANYFDVGVLAGELAGKVLHGTDPATIPIKDVAPERLIFNTTALKGLTAPWKIPPRLMAKADGMYGPDGLKMKKEPKARTPRPLPKKWKMFLVRYNDSPLTEDATRGVHDGLKKAGLVEGRDFTLKVESAQGDIATLNTIFASIKGQGADMVMTFSTPTLQAAVHKFTRTPIVFSVVADAVVAGAGKSTTDHRPNVTGITTEGAFDLMPGLLKECMPNVKRVGTLFTPGEANSVHNKDELKGYLKEAGVELVDVPVNSSAEVVDSAMSLCSKDIEAVCQCIDNLTSASFPSIARAAKRAKLPVFGFVSEQAGQGAVACLARDYYDAGIEGALVAARVMRGEDPAKIPITNLKKAMLIVNLKQARKLGVTVPDSVLKRADKVIR